MPGMVGWEHAGDAISEYDLQGRIHAANRSVVSSFSSDSAVVGQTFAELGLDPALSGSLVQNAHDVLQRGEGLRFHIAGTIQGNHQRFDIRLSPGGIVPGATVLCIGRNCEADLPASNSDGTARLLEDLYHNAPCAHLCVDGGGIVRRANRRSFEWLGIDARYVDRGRAADLFEGASVSRFEAMHTALWTQEESSDVELEIRGTAGPARWVVASGALVRGDGDEPLGARYAFIDITARRDAELTLRRLAMTDELTGLYNLRGFKILLEREIALCERRGGRGSLLFLDVDGLKHINDTHGHDHGSAHLRRCAEHLRRTFRDCDVLGRLSGDEFAIYLPDAPTASVAIQRLRTSLLGVEPDSFGLTPQMSVGGVTVEPGLRLSAEAWLGRADAAMYEDKRARRALGISKPRLEAVQAPVSLH